MLLSDQPQIHPGQIWEDSSAGVKYLIATEGEGVFRIIDLLTGKFNNHRFTEKELIESMIGCNLVGDGTKNLSLQPGMVFQCMKSKFEYLEIGEKYLLTVEHNMESYILIDIKSGFPMGAIGNQDCDYMRNLSIAEFDRYTHGREFVISKVNDI